MSEEGRMHEFTDSLNVSVQRSAELPHSVIARPCLRQGRGDLIEKFFMRLLRYARND